MCLLFQEQYRMALLTLDLDQGKIRFITACVKQWTDGGTLFIIFIVATESLNG